MTEEQLKQLEADADLKKLEETAVSFCSFRDCLNRAVADGLCRVHQPKKARERRPA